jgi:ubiquinone/menaquinone biosynthesis C-methylase UbiE
MSASSRHDVWQTGDSYDAYMGRWSRAVATPFLEWLAAPPEADWLELGCGTGALSGAILARCAPRSLVGIDPSEGFVATARRNVPDARASFEVGDAQSLRQDSASRDVVVSALVLNFVPDRGRALVEMRRVLRPRGLLGFYVWDYPGAGVGFMRAFWMAASAIDPAATDLSEDRRFPFCTQEALIDLARSAGFQAVEARSIAVPTAFRDFDDYWRPFTLGAGPAPGYCASLGPPQREALRARLERDLPRAADGSIPLAAHAWGIRARNV